MRERVRERGVNFISTQKKKKNVESVNERERN